MNPLKQLAGQTAVYGISSIVGRIINFLLTPLYTRLFMPGEYGVVTEMYTYVVFLIIVLTYGMETAFFRFSDNQSPRQRERVFGTTFLSVLSTSVLFMVLVLFFRQPIAETMRYGGNVEYVVVFAIIIGLDALASIPFARLRAENRPLRFAIVKLTGIVVNISLVLFLLLACPWLLENGPEWVSSFIQLIYYPEFGVGYIFVANLVATLVSMAMLMPVIIRVKPVFDPVLLRKMLIYALPLLLAGLAGWINEALDKLLLKYILPEDIALSQVGIYGAVYKLSILMTIFIQAFRFAAEPFYFAHAREAGSREMYARIMNYFVMACLVIFLGVTLFIDVVKHFIGPHYHEGLSVVPVLLLANLFLGIYINLSIWYKLASKTIAGAWFALIGALITIVLNLWLIPKVGYHGSAWTTLVCYVALAVMCYFTGRKHYPIPYDVGGIALRMLVAMGIFAMGYFTARLPWLAHYGLNGLMIVGFVVWCVRTDKILWSGFKSVVMARKGS